MAQPKPKPKPKQCLTIDDFGAMIGHGSFEGMQRHLAEKRKHDEAAKGIIEEIRMSMCGKPLIKGDAKNGYNEKGTYICGIWDKCPHCYERRKKLVYKRYKDAVEACKEPVAVRLEQDAMKALRSQLGIARDQHKSWVTTDDDVMVLDAAEYDLTGIETVPVESLDIDELVRTPEGRRPSGSLGYNALVVEEDPEDPTITVNVPKVIAEAGKGHRLVEAEITALEATQHFTPELSLDTLEQDIGYLEWCLRKRWFDAYKDAVKSMGGKILHTSTCRQSFKLSSYKDWGEEIQTILPKLYKCVDKIAEIDAERGERGT